MSRFSGNNNSKTLKTAFDRANYKLNAYKPNDVQVVDFHFAEKSFYGRVNRYLDPVIIDETYLRTFHNQDFRVLHFARDQFKEMNIRYQNALDLSLISNNEQSLSRLKITRAYESPLELYKNTMEEFMDIFLTTEAFQKEKKIESFESFLTVFENYVTNRDLGKKITFSGFMKSGESNIFNSGMALQIGNTPFSNDAQKEQQILNSKNFSFYKNIAKQFGFSINMQNPSVLVTDLAHPVTTKFREKYDLFTVNRVFEKHYLKAHVYDFDLLVDYLVNTYNSLVYLKPNLKQVFICNNKVQSNIYLRNNIDKVNHDIILLLYIKIRNMEEFFSFSNQEVTSIFRTSKRLLGIDQETAIRFIESQFRSRYNIKNGSLTYYQKKVKK